MKYYLTLFSLVGISFSLQSAFQIEQIEQQHKEMILNQNYVDLKELIKLTRTEKRKNPSNKRIANVHCGLKNSEKFAKSQEDFKNLVQENPTEDNLDLFIKRYEPYNSNISKKQSLSFILSIAGLAYPYKIYEQLQKNNISKIYFPNQQKAFYVNFLDFFKKNLSVIKPLFKEELRMKSMLTMAKYKKNVCEIFQELKKEKPRFKTLNSLINMCNINEVDEEGNTLLHVASKNNHPFWIAKLQTYIPLNKKNNNGHTAFHISIISRANTVFEKFMQKHMLEKVALYTPDNMGNNALHLATMHNNTYAFYTLFQLFDLDYLNCKNTEGNTLLHLSIKAENE